LLCTCDDARLALKKLGFGLEHFDDYIYFLGPIDWGFLVIEANSIGDESFMGV